MFHPKHVLIKKMNFKNIIWFIKAIFKINFLTKSMTNTILMMMLLTCVQRVNSIIPYYVFRISFSARSPSHATHSFTGIFSL